MREGARAAASGSPDGAPTTRGTEAVIATDSAPDPLPAFVVGYPLEVTLSESGGVSRGICEVDGTGTLQRLAEGFEMRRSGNRVRGRDVAGRRVDVPLDTPVCTNLWGFPDDSVNATSRRGEVASKRAGGRFWSLWTSCTASSRFEFLASGPGLDREFYLTEAVNDLIAAGLVHCKVLPTRERWLGVTFPEDHAGVAESLRSLVDSGVYPMRLWDAPPTLPAQG